MTYNDIDDVNSDLSNKLYLVSSLVTVDKSRLRVCLSSRGNITLATGASTIAYEVSHLTAEEISDNSKILAVIPYLLNEYDIIPIGCRISADSTKIAIYFNKTATQIYSLTINFATFYYV